MSKDAPEDPDLKAQVDEIVRNFEVSAEDIRNITTHFVSQMRDGLKHPRPWQLPAYVTHLPDGSEQGTFLAVDLGGSNCRVCLVVLNGDSTFAVVQKKHVVPPELMVNHSYKPLFAFIANKVAEFLNDHAEMASQGEGRKDSRYQLGFTFSFACRQTSLREGTLMSWDKGWDIPDAIGQSPCVMLQEAIDSIGAPVAVSVLANDSVGTLLTRCYTARERASTVVAGVILGTGTNAAYVERLSNMHTLARHDKPDGIMVINTEWAGLDDGMRVLPRTRFDDELDKHSSNQGLQMLEKRVSGLYLGELLRLTILRLVRANAFSMETLDDSRIFQRDSIGSSFLSRLAMDGGDDTAAKDVESTLSVRGVTVTDVQEIRRLAMSIGSRAAALAGAALGAVIIQSGRLEPPSSLSPPVASKEGPAWKYLCGINMAVQMLKGAFGLSKDVKDTHRPEPPLVDIGVDGSLIEFYPGFIDKMRNALSHIPEIGPTGESRIQIGFAKDGSGVGAALMAQAAAAQSL